MPGFDYAENVEGGVGAPEIKYFPIGNNLQGPNGINVSGTVWKGDLVVATVSSTYNASPQATGPAPVVIRPLLQSDITSGLTQGILGVSVESFTSDVYGRFGPIPYPPQYMPLPSEVPNPSYVFSALDPFTARHSAPVFLSWEMNSFAARISPAFTGAQGKNLENVNAGLDLITGIATPTVAPTLTTATTGGTIGAGTYYVLYTYKNLIGETASSPVASITTTGTTSTITVTAPAAQAGQTAYNVYVGLTATGPFYLQATQTSATTNTTLTTLTIPGVTQAPIYNTTGNPGQTIYTINPNTTPAVVRILRNDDITNPWYGLSFPTGNIQTGVRVFCKFLTSVQQLNPSNNTVPYTT